MRVPPPSPHTPRPAPPANRPIHRGMPPLDTSGKPVSYFEFWPQTVFYAPIALQWCWLALRHRGSGLAMLANPLFPDGGMAGESKLAIFETLTGASRALMAPCVGLTRSAPGPAGVADDLDAALRRMAEAGLAFPVVAKPDIGCRGVGVQPVRDTRDLARYLEAFPPGADLVLQELVDHEAEAGIFYVRLPGEPRGRIFSLTLKYFPHVIGDGVSTLDELIARDPRAGRLRHIYAPRHAARLNHVLPAGEPFRLTFAGSHSRGTIFRNGAAHITPAMEEAIDAVAQSIPEFYFGRFDVRCESLDALKAGTGFRLIEINGAGGEATHIWDRDTTLAEAYRVLFEQNRLLFEIGARNRARGFAAPSIRRLYDAWRRERRLFSLYPQTR